MNNSLNKTNLGLALATALFSLSANATSLNGKYDCLYEAMDIEFSLEFNSGSQYTQDMDFIGIEEGKFSIESNIITFTPTKKSINGKERKVPTLYKRNIISNDSHQLVMTNLNDSDQFVCKK